MRYATVYLRVLANQSTEICRYDYVSSALIQIFNDPRDVQLAEDANGGANLPLSLRTALAASPQTYRFLVKIPSGPSPCVQYDEDAYGSSLRMFMMNSPQTNLNGDSVREILC